MGWGACEYAFWDGVAAGDRGRSMVIPLALMAVVPAMGAILIAASLAAGGLLMLDGMGGRMERTTLRAAADAALLTPAAVDAVSAVGIVFCLGQMYVSRLQRSAFSRFLPRPSAQAGM